VPAKYRWVLQLSDDCLEQIKSDLPNMSGKEKKMAEGINLLWTCAMLGLAEAKERGFTVDLPNGGWDYQPGVKTAGGFLDKAMNGMKALGLKRLPKPVQSLNDYVKSKAATLPAPMKGPAA